MPFGQLVSVFQLINTLRLRQNCRHFADNIFKCTFFNENVYDFRLRFHWGLFLRFQLTIFQHWFRSWLGDNQVTSHYLNRWWIIYWRIYASLGLNKFWKLENDLLQVKHVKTISTAWYPKLLLHDNIIKWIYFPRHWPFVRGIRRSPADSPHKGHRRGALIFSLICAWTNAWTNNGRRRFETTSRSLGRHSNDFFFNENFHLNKKLIQGPFRERFSIGVQIRWNCFYCNFIAIYQIVTKFCTCHNSTSVVPCAKFHSDHITTAYSDESKMKFSSNSDGKMLNGSVLD